MNLEQKTDLTQDLRLLLKMEESLASVENSLKLVNNHVISIDQNLQAVELRIEKTNAILGINTESLVQHMARTALLEKAQAEDRQRYFQLMMSLVISMAGVIIAVALKH